MDKGIDRLKKVYEYGIPWLVLAILLFYSYIDFFRHPFGFAWLQEGNIVRVFVEQPSPTLMVGDRLVQVGSLSWEKFRADLRRTFFEDTKIGEVAPVVVERDGQIITIPWRLPGFNQGEFMDQLIAQWFLAYFFWLAGLLTVLLLRPKDERWWLLSAFNFLTAIWLIAGSGPSNYHLWYSALVLRAAIWLSVPVYLHLHWVFPRPLGKLPPTLLWFAYGFALMLAITQWFQLFSRDLYFLGFLVAILGSLILLFIHFVRQPEVRREVRILAIVALFAFLPTIGVGVFSLIHPIPELLVLPLITFTTIPFAYLYITYRRQLGELEVRVNRLISIYFFVILLMTFGLPLLAVMNLFLPAEGSALIIGTLATVVTMVLSLWGFPRFQNFVEQRILGISTPPDQIRNVYSARSTSSTSINALVDLLRDVMLPSLLVRQFLFVQFEAGSAKVLLTTGTDEKQDPSDEDLAKLIALRDGASGVPPKARPFPWVRLTLPLTVGKEVIGLWLFGRRDPDDFYSQQDLPMLRSLADQTAMALSNIIQTERLHAAFQDSIKREEQGRQQLALELHDSVLNKMAALMMRLDDQSITPEFQESYSELTDQVRELVKDLRPAALSYGLRPAIEEYADTFKERSKDGTDFVVDLHSDDSRYPQDVEQHLFRIVQEACTNAVKHAHPSRVAISGRLEADLIELSVQDNGRGFDPAEKLNLTSLQAGGHFGLTGMFERAELIGATIVVHSEPEKGTFIQITWKPAGG